ncbi:hypothetical protein BO94DRAFT_128039 [Aspergillus sclerotioniger CBS 115572]|uniref:Uncharacterized protein n=1 Tax=Aspergillus sclerotioniger CBS 115572 TaxID=1450535 RepID=A0A317XBL2_9EURO|nr:hypothetical protein BO94DRAFT_128039 [Aspergillus sclerotioniger CBS 115572]PWY95501.1 hypothetical protein BO94DRAFT_128039 [Aspergillus sclerotioniger CBS 115572]
MAWRTGTDQPCQPWRWPYSADPGGWPGRLCVSALQPSCSFPWMFYYVRRVLSIYRVSTQYQVDTILGMCVSPTLETTRRPSSTLRTRSEANSMTKIARLVPTRVSPRTPTFVLGSHLRCVQSGWSAALGPRHSLVVACPLHPWAQYPPHFTRSPSKPSLVSGDSWPPAAVITPGTDDEAGSQALFWSSPLHHP